MLLGSQQVDQTYPDQWPSSMFYQCPLDPSRASLEASYASISVNSTPEPEKVKIVQQALFINKNFQLWFCSFFMKYSHIFLFILETFWISFGKSTVVEKYYHILYVFPWILQIILQK